MANKDVRYWYIGPEKPEEKTEEEFPDLPENPLLRHALPEPTKEGGFLYYQFYTRVIKIADQSPEIITLVLLKPITVVVFLVAVLSSVKNRMSAGADNNFFSRVLSEGTNVADQIIPPVFHTAFYLMLANLLICLAAGIVNAYTVRTHNDRIHFFFAYCAGFSLVLMIIIRGLLWNI